MELHTKESAILKIARLIATKLGIITFRNNVGKTKTQDGRFINFGLCKGSSDLIGWKTVQINETMIGKTVAVFVAIECKREGGVYTPEQITFLNNVGRAGGIAIKFSKESDLEEQLSKWNK